MPNFKKISGNYIEITDLIGLPAAFYASQSLEAFRGQIDKDLHRTCYLSFEHTVSSMKEKLSDSSHLSDEGNSYTQGNFDGGVFNQLMITLSPKAMETAKLVAEEGTQDGLTKSLRVAYIDDDGACCGLSIGYLRDDPDLSKGEAFVPLEQRKRLFSVCIIKNTNFAPKDRAVTLITHPVFVKEAVAQASTDVNETDVPAEINGLLNSKNISSLLSGMFNGEAISTGKFDELCNRIDENRNIDNRDAKKLMLEEFVRYAKEIVPNNADLQAYFNQIEQSSSSDIDFYKEDNFELALNGLFAKIETELALELHLSWGEKSEIEYLRYENAKHSLLTDARLTYYAIQLELKAFAITEQSGAVLRESYMEQAQKLRALRDDPQGEKDAYKKKTFFQLEKEVKDLALKRGRVMEFLARAQRECYEDPEALAYVEQSKNELSNSIELCTEEKLKELLYFAQEAFSQYMADKNRKDALVLQEKITDFVTQLESHSEALADEPDYMRQGFLNKAQTLKNLSSEAAKKYKTADWNTVLEETITEIESERFKENFLARLTNYANNLPNKAPPFLKERIEEKVAKMRSTTLAHQMVKKYYDKNFKAATAELVTGLFQDEKVRQERKCEEGFRKRGEDKRQALLSSAPEASFFRRNRGLLLAGGGSALALISLVLVLTGVFAPFGIVLGTAATVIAGLEGIVVAGVALWAVNEVVSNERQFSEDMKEYQNRVALFNTEAAIAAAQCNSAVAQLGASLDEAQTAFMKEHFEETEVREEQPLDREVVLNETSMTELAEADHLLEEAERMVSTGEQAALDGFSTTVRLPISTTSETPNTATVGDEAVAEANQTISDNNINI